MFSLFNFSSIFPGGQLTPFAPMCGRPCMQVIHTDVKYRFAKQYKSLPGKSDNTLKPGSSSILKLGR